MADKTQTLTIDVLTPGGTKTSGVALVLAVLAVVATFLVDTTAAFLDDDRLRHVIGGGFAWKLVLPCETIAP